MALRYSQDYIDRTIATVRNHRDAENCWPQWANIFADHIEDLRVALERAERTERLCAICTPERDHNGSLCRRHASEKIIRLANEKYAIERLLDEWLALGNLPGGGFGGTLKARTEAALGKPEGQQ